MRAEKPQKPTPCAPFDGSHFEEAIRADRDDPTPWLVYADALQAAGDPRGELIVLQARQPKTAAIARAQDALLDAHYKHIVGDGVEELQAEQLLEVTWKNGFFESASIHIPNGHFAERHANARRLVTHLFDSPSAPFLDDLRLDAWAPQLLDAVIDQIAEARRPPPLRSLTVVYNMRASPEPIAIDRALAVLPMLRRLEIKGGMASVGEARLQLEELRVETPLPPLLPILGSKPWPNLRRLSLGGTMLAAADLAPLFATKALPNLQHLGLGPTRISDALADLLAKSPLYSQLSSLDLGRGTLTKTGAGALLAAKRTKLDVLDVTSNWLDAPSVKALSAIATKVLASKQKT